VPPPIFQPFALFLYEAGPRLSEALDLDWPDVALAARNRHGRKYAHLPQDHLIAATDRLHG
jgi:integrase